MPTGFLTVTAELVRQLLDARDAHASATGGELENADNLARARHR